MGVHRQTAENLIKTRTGGNGYKATPEIQIVIGPHDQIRLFSREEAPACTWDAQDATGRGEELTADWKYRIYLNLQA